MTIIDKLNEIEARTIAIAHEARLLEEDKSNYEGLLECEVQDHVWNLVRPVGSNLRHVQTIHIECERCKCYAMYSSSQFQDGQIPITHHTDVLVKDLIPEEGE